MNKEIAIELLEAQKDVNISKIRKLKAHNATIDEQIFLVNNPVKRDIPGEIKDIMEQFKPKGAR